MLALAVRTVFVRQAADNTAAELAFVGAIVVAMIAAVTAQRRLQAQLDHDRRLADLADLRAVVEKFVLLIHGWQDDLNEMRRLRQAVTAIHQELRDNLDNLDEHDLPTPEQDQLTAELDELARKVITTDDHHRAALVAAVIRLPIHHPFVEAVRATVDPMRLCLSAVNSASASEWEAAIEALNVATATVDVEAQRVVGSKL